MYLRRSVKYFFAVCVFCVVIMLLNRLTGMAQLTFEQTLYVMFHTPRGLLLPVAIVVISAFYPRFGFARRRVEGDIEADRQQVMTAFDVAGFSLCREEGEELVFRADSPLRRAMMLWEDEVRVSQYGQWIYLDGNRRALARVLYQLESYLKNKRRHEQTL